MPFFLSFFFLGGYRACSGMYFALWREVSAVCFSAIKSLRAQEEAAAEK